MTIMPPYLTSLLHSFYKIIQYQLLLGMTISFAWYGTRVENSLSLYLACLLQFQLKPKWIRDYVVLNLDGLTVLLASKQSE